MLTTLDLNKNISLHSLLGMSKVKRDESKKGQSVSPSKEVSKPKQKSSWSFVIGVIVVGVVIAAVLGLYSRRADT